MPENPTISAILITRDEEENIDACLRSLAFCEEVVVVDGGSDDRTVELARSLGAKVHVDSDWRGFGVQKQRALDLATGEWVLSVDADERVPEDLRAEIETAVREPGAAGYLVKRLTWFLGEPLRHGGWHPDYVLRLARREAARFEPLPVHERLVVEGAVGRIEAPLHHYSYRTVDDVLAKMRRYARDTAELRRRHGRRGGLAVAVGHATFGFFKAYLLQGGLRDGRRGFVAAAFRSQEAFWRYIAAGWERDR